MTLIDAARVVLFFGFAFFCYCYHWLAPWWASELGRSMMAWPACGAVLTGLGILKSLAPGAIWINWVQGLVFIGLIIAVYWRLALMLRLYRKPKEKQDVDPRLLEGSRGASDQNALTGPGGGLVGGDS